MNTSMIQLNEDNRSKGFSSMPQFVQLMQLTFEMDQKFKLYT